MKNEETNMEKGQVLEHGDLLIVVIAGGRYYQFTDEDKSKLDALPIGEVVSGGAKGADQFGEQWAESRGIPMRRFSADWKAHGRAAGPIRNCKMAEYADAVVLFPGGRGTASMRKEAEKAGVTVFDFTGKITKRFHFELILHILVI